jgi:nucleotide-binding universal stress UspA family protein
MADAPVPDTYLVVMDSTAESRRALRYGALRALRIGGRLRLLHVIQPANFVQWGAIEAEMEAEAKEEAAALLADSAAEAATLLGQPPETELRHGTPADEILAAIREHGRVRALILAAATKGRPGPLIEYFSSDKAAQLPCLLTIIPASLPDEALDRLA